MESALEAQIAADLPPIAAVSRRERLNATTKAVIGAALKVHTKLGVGFLEKVYENSLAVEFQRSQIRAERQRSILVEYEGVVVGQYMPDLIVENDVIVEIKAVTFLDRVHRQQCVNYLRATGFQVCLLLNFGRTSLEVRRLVHRF